MNCCADLIKNFSPEQYQSYIKESRMAAWKTPSVNCYDSKKRFVCPTIGAEVGFSYVWTYVLIHLCQNLVGMAVSKISKRLLLGYPHKLAD